MTSISPELASLFVQKYGPPESQGWAPRQRYRFGYFLPADVYESVIADAVRPETRWLDVGGGHAIFPENPALARRLADRCARLVAVDPSDNVRRNEFAQERVQAFLEDFTTTEQFDLATMRMVVEHVAQPEKFVESLSRLVVPGGQAIVFTVNKRAPISLLSRWTPFSLHHPLKRLVWGGEEEDTFPVQYRMNTRRELARLFDRAGFDEQRFQRLDDLSAFGLFRRLNFIDLQIWRVLHALGVPYPENCLLGVYRRRR